MQAKQNTSTVQICTVESARPADRKAVYFEVKLESS